MGRDIDSPRGQNECTNKKIESLRSESKRIKREAEQLRGETETLCKQNNAPVRR